MVKLQILFNFVRKPNNREFDEGSCYLCDKSIIVDKKSTRFLKNDIWTDKDL